VTAVYVGLGANLGDPPVQIENALAALGDLVQTVLVRRSRVYRSRPMGPADQPPFANAVAQLDTVLEPLALLDALLGIERRHGRVRAAATKNGPRHLDLDLLLYGDIRLEHPRLTLPHPGTHRRDFMLVPLLEIAPDITIPGLGRAVEWLPRCARHDLAPWPTQAAPATA
jgi:2-amino-4-hydroxy-6-hydroxymethyldihydropteridine diphosphokinase